MYYYQVTVYLFAQKLCLKVENAQRDPRNASVASFFSYYCAPTNQSKRRL